MSDDQKGAANAEGQEGADDRIGNLKAEMNRKLGDLNSNLTKENQDLKSQLTQIMGMIEQKNAAGKPTAAAEKKLTDLIYDDPDQFVERVKQSTRDEVMRDVNRQQGFQSTAANLENEYPEFRDRNSEQYKRVQAYYQQLPKELWNTQQGLETAAYKAAADFGLVPQSKRRSADTDDFSMGGASPSRAGGRTSKASDGEMKPEQKAFAELLGIDTSNAKFKEHFKKASKRTDYGRYKGEE
jgi:hypothetical protein